MIQAINSKKIKCKEYCLTPMSTVSSTLEEFKKEFSKSSIVDIQINQPFIIFFYIDETDLNKDQNNVDKTELNKNSN